MTVPLPTPPLWGLVFAISGGLLLWLVSLRRKDASIVDIFWGPGVAGVVDIAAIMAPAAGPRASTALLLVNIWAVRLAAHAAFGSVRALTRQDKPKEVFDSTQFVT